ncbi:amidohydrolase family protein [Paenibacillus aceris]|uniref:L-fuconolactonase n=1 Tax=Paenibacillus aceris TaxID=869555 RepID=A0ABS4I358_9BACL|nr:amidohydrolase family protein [Paenibacillus aceris]MBP1965335.1 L-fuconolactonase [Paenibacillus aceris]NHW36015.1 amidohydrolase family protein [Paenibacillus aceris]
MRIDAHQHYWTTSRSDYGWLTPENSVLYRDYLPSDLKPALKHNRVQKTIVVQAAPTVAETKYLLELSEQEPTIAGVVGWLDMEREDFEDQLSELRRHPKFVGIRPMLQDREPEYLLSPKLIKAFAILEEQQFPLDWLVYPKHLPNVGRIMEQFPRLLSVIDHLGKPSFVQGKMEPWQTDIAKLAQYDNMYCKMSGMVTEMEGTSAPQASCDPFVQHCLAVFGEDRVMFGSDWPVCLLAAEYNQVIELLTAALPLPYTDEAKKKLFGDNASRFYKL